MNHEVALGLTEIETRTVEHQFERINEVDAVQAHADGVRAIHRVDEGFAGDPKENRIHYAYELIELSCRQERYQLVRGNVGEHAAAHGGAHALGYGFVSGARE